MADNQPVLTLADIAGVDLNQVEEVRFTNLPEMVAQFEVTATSLEMIDRGEKMKGPGAVVECTVKECIGLTDTNLKKEEQVSKTQKQTFMFRNLEDIGRFKAWVADAGVVIAEQIPLPDVVKGIKGLIFNGKCIHTVDKNDKEKVYANIRPTVAPKTA